MYVSDIFQNYFTRLSETLVEFNLNNKSQYYEDFAILFKQHILIAIYINNLKEDAIICIDKDIILKNLGMAEKKSSNKRIIKS